MTKDNNPQEHEETPSNNPTSKRIADPTSCPKCGAGLKRQMFRTGSTQHPGRDMLVCTRCGNRK